VDKLGIYFKTLPAIFPSRFTRKIMTKTVNPRGRIVIMPVKKNDLSPFFRDLFFFTSIFFVVYLLGKKVSL